MYNCLNGGKNKPDGSCDCSTAIETLTDCSHSGGLGNRIYSNYNGNGNGNDGRVGGNSYTVQYTGESCEIPGKLPDNFVKWLNHDGWTGYNCEVNRECSGNTTQCVEDNWECRNDPFPKLKECRNNGTICGTNQNNLDHKCTT